MIKSLISQVHRDDVSVVAVVLVVEDVFVLVLKDTSHNLSII